MKDSVQPVPDWRKILQQDDVMAQIIAQGQAIEQAPHEDIYVSLLGSIIGQQLSTKVARVIRNRFFALFPDNYPTPALVLAKTDEALRSVGLSFQKISYIRNVAIFATRGQLNYSLLSALDDEAFIKHLTQIKGVGRWTAEMILMFTLCRPDVFPIGDLGIQNAMKKHYNLTTTGKELVADLQRIAESWRPHRTVACCYLWQSLDNSQ